MEIRGFSEWYAANYFDIVEELKTYGAVVACLNCGGTGVDDCPDCTRENVESCNTCEGSGIETCPVCKGEEDQELTWEEIDAKAGMLKEFLIRNIAHNIYQRQLSHDRRLLKELEAGV